MQITIVLYATDDKNANVAIEKKIKMVSKKIIYFLLPT